MVHTRQLMSGAQRVQPKLYVVDGKSMIGSMILQSAHQHYSGIPKILSRVYEMGFFVIGARALIRKAQLSCTACIRTRAEKLSRLLGPSPVEHFLSQRMPHYAIVQFDHIGPFKTHVSRNKTGKAWIFSIACLSSRHVTFIPCTDCLLYTSDAADE